MSRWIDTFKQHPVQSILLEFNTKLNSYKLDKDAGAKDIEEYSRLRKVVKYIDAINSSIDPDLISPNVLHEMQGALNEAFNQFNEYISNKNVGHLENANNNIDNILNIISRTFIYYKKPAKNALSDIIQTYSETLGQHQEQYKLNVDYELERVEGKSKELSESLEQMSNDTNALSADLKGTQSQIQTILAEFNTQFQNSQAALQQRADGAINNANKKFSEQFDGFESRFGSLAQRSKIEADRLLKDSQDKIDKQFVDLSIKSGVILNILTKLQDEAQTVFGVVQNTVQAGAHKRYADEERFTANWYRYGALLLMLISVGILIAPEVWNYLYVKDYVLSWAKIVDRLPISLIIFAPAFYLARESSKHRLNEFQNRRRELTLRTIDPYLALLKDETQRDDLKGQIAKSIFSEDKLTSTDGGDITANIVSILDNVSRYLNRKAS